MVTILDFFHVLFAHLAMFLSNTHAYVGDIAFFLGLPTPIMYVLIWLTLGLLGAILYVIALGEWKSFFFLSKKDSVSAFQDFYVIRHLTLLFFAGLLGFVIAAITLWQAVMEWKQYSTFKQPEGSTTAKKAPGENSGSVLDVERFRKSL